LSPIPNKVIGVRP